MRINISKELERVKKIGVEIDLLLSENRKILRALNGVSEKQVIAKGFDGNIVVKFDGAEIVDIYKFVPEEWREYEEFQRGPSQKAVFHREAEVVHLSEEEKAKIREEYQNRIQSAIEARKLYLEYGKAEEELRQMIKENNKKVDELRKEIENTPEAKALMGIRTDNVLRQCYYILDPYEGLFAGHAAKYSSILDALVLTKKRNPELLQEIINHLKSEYNIELEVA